MPAGSQLRRLFFALWPPEALRARLERNTHSLVRDSGGRVIPARNFHVTVVFVGEVPQSRLNVVMAAAAATSSPAFTLALDRIEAWPGSKVLVLSGASTPLELTTLVTRLRFNLLSRQIELKPGVYRPHITLARNLPRASPAPSPQVAAMAGSESVEWPVSEFVLIESTVTRSGSDYRVLARRPLA